MGRKFYFLFLQLCANNHLENMYIYRYIQQQRQIGSRKVINDRFSSIRDLGRTVSDSANFNTVTWHQQLLCKSLNIYFTKLYSTYAAVCSTSLSTLGGVNKLREKEGWRYKELEKQRDKGLYIYIKCGGEERPKLQRSHTHCKWCHTRRFKL